MRLAFVFALLAALAGCGGAPVSVDGGSGSAPPGFGTDCRSSEECRGFAVDAGPGFLGCYSYLGPAYEYCSAPCAPSPAGVDRCWPGSTCRCVEHENAGGFAESDCFCQRGAVTSP